MSPTDASTTRPQPGPLRGLCVLDLSRLVAGNVLTQQLADFGADVIKVEPPAGDTLRQWQVEGIATTWMTHARNKKSIAIDFRRPRAIELLLELVVQADCLVESFRPGTLEAMGLAPERLLERNPRLVIVRISGWGQDGPYSRQPGFGTLVEGLSGFAALNGFADREPLLPPIYLADSVAGLQGAAATLMALREVEVNGGSGQVIDLSLLDPLVSMLGPQVANYRLTGQVRPRTGNRSTNSAPRNSYRTADGQYLCLSASTQQMTERLLRAIGRPELVDDPRFRTNRDRLANWAALDAIIGEFIGARDALDALAFFRTAEITVGPMLDASQVADDPQVRARGLYVEIESGIASEGPLPIPAPVPRLGRTPGTIDRPAPRLGQHNAEVFARIGIDPPTLDALCRDGIIHGVADAS